MTRRRIFSGFSMAIMALLLASCAGISASSEIVGSTQDRVWIKRPFLTDGDTDEMAAAFCAETGRAATFESEMNISDAKRIAVYLCQ